MGRGGGDDDVDDFPSSAGASTPSSSSYSSSSKMGPAGGNDDEDADNDGDGDALLTSKDMRELNSKYETLRCNAMEGITNNLLRASLGDNDDDGITRRRGGRDDEDKNDESSSISKDEARRIMEYAIEEDRIMEMRELRNKRKGELVNEWEARVNEVEGGGGDGRGFVIQRLR
ncbi:hypothetical protein ACHAXA_006660 [Cyclostephanos tholiformis]|uniref:Uncharacterized protein n=1 Tax=Cyclostephanos tholiformis TaxID=382380 RepID=A0ABD3R3E6_9STRA